MPSFLFQGEDVAAIDEGAAWWKPSSLPSGEYLAVTCIYGDVGGGYMGITEILTKRVVFTKTEEISDTYRSWKLLEDISLSPKQCEAIVAFLTREVPFHWQNTSPGVKAKLQAGEADPREEEARRLLREGGFLWRTKQNLAAARRVLEQALGVLPSIRNARADLGRMALEMGSVDEAIEYFRGELALARDPDDFTAHAYLALIYEAQGRTADAQRHAGAAAQTRAYKEHPGGVALVPEAKEIVRVAVQRSLAAKNTAASPSGVAGGQRAVEHRLIEGARPDESSSTGFSEKSRKWWRFWK